MLTSLSPNDMLDMASDSAKKAADMKKQSIGCFHIVPSNVHLCFLNLKDDNNGEQQGG